jgi:transposase
MTSEYAKYVGMDVGKSWLDIAVWGEAKIDRVSNDPTGVSELVEQMSELEPTLVVVEATGGYERLVVEELFSSGFPVSVANPTRVRALAKATGKLAKTDDIDAALIAEYAAKVQPDPVGSKTESELHLRALVTRRHQLLEMRTAEKNRLKTAHHTMKGDIGEHIDWISARIQELECEMLSLSQSLPDWQEQVQLMESYRDRVYHCHHHPG